MQTAFILGLVFLAVVVLIIAWLVGMYNTLVTMKKRVENAWVRSTSNSSAATI